MAAPASPRCVSFLAVALLTLAGCSSDTPVRQSRVHFKPPPPLAGQGTYFDGAVVADIKLGAGLHMSEDGPGGDHGGSGGGKRPHGGGTGFQMNGGGGSGGYGGNVGVSPGGGGRRQRGGEGMDGDSGDATFGESGPPGVAGGGMRRPAGGPPVMIHILLTNKGATPLAISATDFSSLLGNFVVFPEKLTLNPGQAAEFEPMTSRMGGEFSEVTVNLTLSTGSKEEKKAIDLHVVAPPPDQPAPPPTEPGK